MKRFIDSFFDKINHNILEVDFAKLMDLENKKIKWKKVSHLFSMLEM